MTEWLIDDGLAKKHMGMDAGPEGGCKTTFGAWLSVCIASGTPFFGHKVQQGQVLSINEETSDISIEYVLNRFSQSIGCKSYKELPIRVLSKQGFKIGHANTYALDTIEVLQPVFIRLDSFIAMLPTGRQKLVETNSDLGQATLKTMDSIKSKAPNSTTLLAAHSRKPTMNWSLNEFLEQTEMQAHVRGHSSIVGLACDTGFAFKKISADPLQFVIKIIARRQPVPLMSHKLVYVQMEEETYGKGWARLTQIPPVPIPPSDLVKEYFKLFKNDKSQSWETLNRKGATATKKEKQLALEELVEHHIITNDVIEAFTYKLNPNYKKECEDKYLELLQKNSHTT